MRTVLFGTPPVQYESMPPPPPIKRLPTLRIPFLQRHPRVTYPGKTWISNLLVQARISRVSPQPAVRRRSTSCRFCAFITPSGVVMHKFIRTILILSMWKAAAEHFAPNNRTISLKSKVGMILSLIPFLTACMPTHHISLPTGMAILGSFRV